MRTLLTLLIVPLSAACVLAGCISTDPKHWAAPGDPEGARVKRVIYECKQDADNVSYRATAQGGAVMPIVGLFARRTKFNDCMESRGYRVDAAAGSEVPPQRDIHATTRGTGFIVHPDGVILTALHVVEDAGTITVKCPSGVATPAQIEQAAKQNDLALLRLTTASSVDYMSLAMPRSARTGDSVFTIGFPATAVLGTEPKFTEGSISALSGPGGEASLLQISVPLQPGNSGGPLVDRDGHVVGIVTSSAAVAPFLRATGALPQNVNWSVKSEYATSLFDAPGRQAPAQDRRAAIERALAATCMIESRR